MTETSNNGFKQVYKSTAREPFEVWFAPKDAEVSFPFVEEAPDPKLKSPMFDWNKYCWFESDSKVQGEQISEMSQSLDKLKNDVASGKLSDEALNQQLGTLVAIVSQKTSVQQAASPSTDNKANSTTDTTSKDGGAK